MRKITSRLTFANVAAALALFLAITTSGVARPVAQTADSVSKDVKKALGLSKKANRIATKALAHARRAEQIASGVSKQGVPKGMKGEKGEQGEKGATGPPGLIGPSEAITKGPEFRESWTWSFFPSCCTPGDTRVMSLSLQAGSYLLFAKAQLSLSADAIGPALDAVLTCDLTYGPPPSHLPIDTQRIELREDPLKTGTFVLAGAVELREPDVVSLDCRPGGTAGPNDAMNLDGPFLSAVKVGQLLPEGKN
jgi:hypothetical protein